MDYDLTNIPAVYDRGRDLGPEVLDLWMSEIEMNLGGQAVASILDLGCGTGRFSEALAARFNAEVLGIDPSTKMLKRASEKRRDSRVRYAIGRAEDIPLPTASVDMVFISMSFHHFDDPTLAARECRRVLVRQGRVFVRTGTREHISMYPYVPFFPASVPVLQEVLPDRTGIRQVFEAAGFHTHASRIVTQAIAPSWLAYADKLSAGADSVLTRLTREELESGFAALRQHATGECPQPIVEPIDLLVFH